MNFSSMLAAKKMMPLKQPQVLAVKYDTTGQVGGQHNWQLGKLLCLSICYGYIMSLDFVLYLANLF